MKKIVAIFAICLCIFTIAQSASVTLEWDPSPDDTVVGYNVFYGVMSRLYTNRVSAGSALTLTLNNIPGGSTYYFAATAYTAEGLESDFSEEIFAFIPLTTDTNQLNVVSFRQPSNFITEGETATFEIISTNYFQKTFDVSYITETESDQLYSSNRVSITIPTNYNGFVTQFVSTIDDSFIETNEVLRVTLIPDTNYVIIGPSVLLWDIRNNDNSPTNTLPWPSIVRNFRLIPKPSATPELSDLILHYTFDQISGNVVIDSSSNNNNGIVYGEMSLSDRPNGGKSFQKNSSTNQYITSGLLTSVTNMGTLSLWFNTTNVINNDFICGNGNWATDRNGFILAEYNRKFYFELCDNVGRTYAIPSTIIDDGIWRLATITWDSTNIVFYIDGEPSVSVSQTRNAVSDVGNFQIGKDASGRYFLRSGYIDDVRVYNRALSSTEILQLYNNTK